MIAHPLSLASIIKKAQVAYLPYLTFGSGLALGAYGSAVSRARDLGRGLYLSIPGIDLPSGPHQEFVDSTIVRKILERDAGDLNELQANLIAEYLVEKLKDRPKRKSE